MIWCRKLQVKDLQFLDTEACYWQLALQNSMQYRAHSKAGIPHLGMFCMNL